ncbi:otoferlin-like [Daktulosphaira vitifoliae]|uniref:otoferlin-like n=1 Tax=Daktulosphaira vitifoliae TaxID=58002 RepID=UPI0021AAEDB3|nr:otoferlin-like [Daktulosphaira vitifoliae]
MTVYDEELESISEFNGFKDNLKSFEIYGYSNDDDVSPSVVATLKANVQIRPELQSNDEFKFSKLKELFLNSLEYQNWPNIKSNIKCKVLVRVYIIRAYDLHPSDSCSLADPYVEVLFGKKHKVSDYNKYVPKTLNPIFGRCYQKVISFPDCSTLIVKIMDHDNFGQDDLIGETSIDIESRYYSRHRPSCGLTRHYDRTGYNKWRDYETPSKILHSLCESNNLKPPTYFKNCVTIGPKKFTIIEHNSVPDKQTLALHVLNHWHEIPVLGYSLVPEHVETRTLQNSNFPNIQRGKLEMWVDIFPQKSTLPNPVDITHPVAEELELRVIVWSVAEVKLVDDNFITGEKHSDIFIKGWLPSVDEQFTDIHYRSLNGEGYFNWRFKFPFSYMKAENRIVEKSKGFFSLEAEEKIYLPRLHIQVWDNDCLTPDSYIGYLSLDLWNLPMGTKSSWKCSLIDDQTPRINLFKTKNTRGWWPFISIENNKNVLVGKIDAELQILTKLEAEKSPAGFGREEPQPLPTPKRHATYFLNSIIDPCAIIIQYFFSVNKVKFFEVFCILGVVLFLLLFLYSIPGYTHTKILLFANVFKLFMRVTNISDVILLQTDLDRLVSWAGSIGLTFNTSKCYKMTFSRISNPISLTYYIHNHLISSVPSIVVFGFRLTPTLNFRLHIEEVCCKALKTLDFIQRISHEFHLSRPLKNLFCSLVRPILEYGSVLWDSYTATEFMMLDRVQRKFLRFAALILNIPHPPHDLTPIQNFLQLPSLSTRRHDSNICFLSKLSAGLIDSPVLLSKLKFRLPARLTRYTVPFLISHSSSNYIFHSALPRLMRIANNGPDFLHSVHF